MINLIKSCESILNSTRIILRANEYSLFSGIDSPGANRRWGVKEKEHFRNYPYPIEYHYNSRGFRDQEWPTTMIELQNSIWCIGDSFTAGVGIPFTHSWPQVLQQTTDRQTINVSLDGASNNWIARHACAIINEIAPQNLIVQWSYSHRREADIKVALDPIWKEYYNNVKDTDWPPCESFDLFNTLPTKVQIDLHNDPQFNSWYKEFDLETPRRLFEVDSTPEENIANTQAAIDLICSTSTTTNVIHTFIPKWHNTAEYELKFHGCPVIDDFPILDLGRDYHHYDIKTATNLVNQLVGLLDKF